MLRLRRFFRAVMAASVLTVSATSAASSKPTTWYGPFENTVTSDSVITSPEGAASTEDLETPVHKDAADTTFLPKGNKEKSGSITPFIKGGLKALPDADPHLAVGHQDPVDSDAMASPSLSDVDGGRGDRRLDGHIETGVQYHF